MSSHCAKKSPDKRLFSHYSPATILKKGREADGPQAEHRVPHRRKRFACAEAHTTGSTPTAIPASGPPFSVGLCWLWMDSVGCGWAVAAARHGCRAGESCGVGGGAGRRVQNGGRGVNRRIGRDSLVGSEGSEPSHTDVGQLTDMPPMSIF